MPRAAVQTDAMGVEIAVKLYLLVSTAMYNVRVAGLSLHAQWWVGAMQLSHGKSIAASDYSYFDELTINRNSGTGMCMCRRTMQIGKASCRSG